MIRRIAFALLATASIPMILHAPAAHAAVAPASLIQMDHISVQVIGKGSPVILIPGLSSPRAVWDGVAPELAKGHSVYLVQVNGFGGDDPRGNLKPGVLAGIVADLDALIVREKLGKPAVVGHSMGGLVGMMLAARHPDRLGRLMIVDSLPWFGVLMSVPGMEASVETVTPQAERMRDAVAAGYGKPADPAAIERNIAGMTMKPENLPRLREWAAKADPRVTAQALYEDLTTDMRAELGRITVPVTVTFAWNETYPRQPQAVQFYTAQYAGVARLNLVPTGPAQHFVMLDQPAAFQAALTAFLAG
ncbi:pimeloyl-ACP methyl ester carboxylesterase [Sphingomonas kyeonggiensis]|uniref:Pimeloyl-ACP methyl ester carboxylesterase n=1 Tax=Sphingomonas kyeonggiensis TaxID=1268553 RepID=A0A7W7K503_9SPHN|nr:alpha/beta hydrolase [Sphingomonas kyeonggiensis]MBB4841154.1 pimeloyl-ACP methyl ester carboxylesterase [Sphingomonas kyeonggiensis]